MLKLWFTLLILSSSLPTRALEISPVLEAGLEFGLNKFGSFNNSLNHNLDAGSGYRFNFGLITTVSNTYPHAFDAQLAIGIISWLEGNEDSQGSTGNSTTWGGFPLEFIYSYRNDRNQFRLGYGLTYRLGNSLSSKRFGVEKSYRLENSLGYLLRIEKFFGSQDFKIGTGLQYTFLQFREASTNTSLNADSIGWFIRLGG